MQHADAAMRFSVSLQRWLTRRLATAGTLACAAAVASSMPGCGDSGPSAAEKRARAPEQIRLPRGSWPSRIAFDDRGTMWISESSADAIAERTQDGRIVQHRLGEATETSVSDMAQGPDGSMWFQGFQVIGWITRSGEVRGYEVGGGPDIGAPAALTAGPDGNIWVAGGGEVRRITADRSFRVYPISDREDGVEITSITAGDDGALWFIQTSSDDQLPPEAIGRLEPEGAYRRIPIPHEDAGATRITAGPDGAMWFTQQSRYSLGRVTPDGEYREFKLEPPVAPFDIVAGRDGALWFTTDKSLGRMTTRGKVRMWPVPGAKDLSGLAQAPDGAFWITDPPADRVHRVVPAGS